MLYLWLNRKHRQKKSKNNVGIIKKWNINVNFVADKNCNNTHHVIMVRNLTNCFLFFLLFITISSAQAQTKCCKPDNTILIISSYNPDTRTTAETLSEFIREYSTIGGTYNVAIESMNCRNLPESKQWRSRMTDILKKYWMVPPSHLLSSCSVSRPALRSFP